MRMTTFFLAMIVMASSCKKSGGTEQDAQPSWPAQTAVPAVNGEAAFSLTATDDYINVMEATVPRMPNYPQAKRKELKMCGYVADLSGKPLQKAFIGLRSAGTVYIAASALTDTTGYYEMNIPLGGADIWAAGYTINYGTGKAAMSLYPTDGQTGLSTPAAGVVKNFVLLSYGLADEDERAEKPWSSAGYFGGSLRFDYTLYDAMWNEHGLPENSEVELKLSPEAGTTLYGETRSFKITRNIGNSNGNFIVNNIPVGKYNITAKLKDGRQLKMRYTGPYVSLYPHHGLQPREAVGTAKVLFTPMGVENKSANANYGGWRPVTITLQLP